MATVSFASLIGMPSAFRGRRAAGGKKVSNPSHFSVGNSSSRHFRPGVPRAVASAKDSSPPLVPKNSTPAPFIKSNNVITATAEKSVKEVVLDSDTNGPLNTLFTSPLLRTPLSGGVENASVHLELPGPAVSCRNLMEQALFGDLCTTMSPMDHRRAGWPVASLVDFATDSEGTPIFSLSPMAMHTRNMKYDPRCSLVVEMPGWRGLASARVTLFGTVKKVPDELQQLARSLFKKKQTEENASYGTSEFPLYMLADIQDVYFVGGYGTVKWVGAKDYLSCSPDRLCDRRFGDPLDVLNKLNEVYRPKIPLLFSDCIRGKIISVDRAGMDMRVKKKDDHYVIQRVRFHNEANSLDEAKREIDLILAKGFKSSIPSAR